MKNYYGCFYIRFVSGKKEIVFWKFFLYKFESIIYEFDFICFLWEIHFLE